MLITINLLFLTLNDKKSGIAILLMDCCGLRIGTIARMREEHIDFEKMQLNLDGELMKNHQPRLFTHQHKIPEESR